MIRNLKTINHRYGYSKFQSIAFILFPYHLTGNGTFQQIMTWKEILNYTKHTKRFDNLFDIEMIDLNKT